MNKHPAPLSSESAEIEPVTEPETSPAAQEDLPIADQFAAIADEAKALVDTEIAYYRAKLDANLAATRRIAAYFGFGIACVTAGLTAFILGLLMTLAPYVGPGLATAIVASGFCILGGILIGLSVKRARRLPIDSETGK